jgi:hypothetical protein
MAKATRLASMTPAEYKAQYGIDASANLVKPSWYGKIQPSNNPNARVPGIKITPKGEDLPVTVTDVNKLLDTFTIAYSNPEYTDIQTAPTAWNNLYQSFIFNENSQQNVAILKKYGIPTIPSQLVASLYATPKK